MTQVQTCPENARAIFYCHSQCADGIYVLIDRHLFTCHARHGERFTGQCRANHHRLFNRLLHRAADLGPLSDHLGRRMPLFIGMVLFIIGSVGCALSTDMSQIVFGESFRRWARVLAQCWLAR